MKTYKLLRQMRDGQLAPLFIEATRRLPLGEYLQAYNTPTKGYAVRPGWHSTPLPDAPHLSTKGRVWVECDVPGEQFVISPEYRKRSGVNGLPHLPLGGWYFWDRPAAQGGKWVISDQIKLVRILSQKEARQVANNL